MYKENRRAPHWWFPFLFGVVFFLRSLVRAFDPSAATVNPYNFLELYGEIPQLHTLASWLGMAVGLLGIFAVIVVEFSRSEPGKLRPLRSPLRLFAFLLVEVGFVITVLEASRGAHLVPDLAHYYHAASGRLSDTAAIVWEAAPLDWAELFFLLGNGLWGLLVSIEILKVRPVRWYLGILGVVFATASILYHLLMQLDAGKLTLMLTFPLYLIIIPLWYISLAFSVRKHERKILTK